MHFNVLLYGGSALHITNDPEEFLEYLYGPGLSPYA